MSEVTTKPSNPMLAVALTSSLVIGPASGGLSYQVASAKVETSTAELMELRREVTSCTQQMAVYNVELASVRDLVEMFRRDLDQLGTFAPRAKLDESVKRKR